MNTHRNCVVCILNQLLRVADYLQLEDEKKDAVLRQALKEASQMPYTQMTAPEVAEKLYPIVYQISGQPDPYRPLRHQQNQMVMDHIHTFREKIKQSPDPLLTAGYYALLGNIIDYGGVRIFGTDEIFKQSDQIDITVNSYDLFKERLHNAQRLLILSDNAGEAVFDLLFIEEIKRARPNLEIHYGVRSKPAINDIIKEDAIKIGIHRVANVLETGSGCAGTIVSRSTDEFKKIYYSSDIIISKGQGNFETLENQPEDILFIFKVKCDIVAQHTGLELNSLVFAFKNALQKV